MIVLAYFSDPAAKRLIPGAFPDLMIDQVFAKEEGREPGFYWFYAEEIGLPEIHYHGPYNSQQEAIDESRKNLYSRFYLIEVPKKRSIEIHGPFADETLAIKSASALESASKGSVIFELEINQMGAPTIIPFSKTA